MSNITEELKVIAAASLDAKPMLVRELANKLTRKVPTSDTEAFLEYGFAMHKKVIKSLGSKRETAMEFVGAQILATVQAESEILKVLMLKIDAGEETEIQEQVNAFVNVSTVLAQRLVKEVVIQLLGEVIAAKRDHSDVTAAADAMADKMMPEFNATPVDKAIHVAVQSLLHQISSLQSESNRSAATSTLKDIMSASMTEGSAVLDQISALAPAAVNTDETLDMDIVESLVNKAHEYVRIQCNTLASFKNLINEHR